ncbi:hypothetical protein [Pontibacter litorisediminis]|uniref:hypothetical protein n=1 Tax=Pontibacter litorisediminis TaxID=1846260 RepID=UPI0023EDC895|nr:hypothetical protein [Pontibacter litorisediminis]
MYKLSYVLLALPLLLFSCNGKEAERAAASEQAITEYRDYVTKFEQDSLSEVELRALEQAENDSLAWQEAKATMQEEYEAQRQRLEDAQENLTPEQRAEADQLDQRYKNALESRQQQYQDASRRYKLRRELLGLEIADDDMSEVTAGNIGQTYTRFASNVKENAAAYDNRDWLLIEGWWSALNSRYRTIEGSLSDQVKKTVQQAQQQYQAIRPQEETSEQQTESPQP